MAAQTGAASFHATGTFTGAGVRTAVGTASLVAVGTEITGGTRATTGSASLVIASTLLAAGAQGMFGSAQLAGAGTLVGSDIATHFGSVVLVASGDMVVTQGGWRLVAPEQVESHPIYRLLRFSVRTPYTVFGDDDGLHTTIDGDTVIPDGTKYVWLGGHINATLDTAIRDLWLANGFQVERDGDD